MISPDQEREIERLLNTGATQRETARQTGVSRATVGNIATGKRPLGLSRNEIRRRVREKPIILSDGPLAHCDECGAMVTQPCIACAARAGKTRHALGVDKLDREIPELDLDLHGETLDRYQEIRAVRESVDTQEQPGPLPTGLPRLLAFVRRALGR